MLSDIQIDSYLKRLNYKENIYYSQEFLNELQKLHYTHIPYENFDILDGIELSLELEVIFKKIVCDYRGGYCFELNGLYFGLLTSIGFEVTNHYARFMLNRPDLIPARSHRILKVQCNNRAYIADVGVYSESPRIALELKEDLVQYDGFAWYKFKKDVDFGWILFQKIKDDDWRRFYSFTEEVYFPTDFNQSSFFYEKSPKSRFNKNPLVAIRTKYGRVAIKDIELIITENNKTFISNYQRAELPEILLKYFYIKTG